MAHAKQCAAMAIVVFSLVADGRAERVPLVATSSRSAVDGANIEGNVLRDGIFDTFFGDSNREIIAFLNGDDSFEIRGALEFDLAPIQQAGSVQSAVLLLQTTTRSQAPSVEGGLNVHGYAGDGVVQLSDLGASHLLAFQRFTSGSEPSLPPLTIEVTSFVQALREVNATHAGFMLSTSPNMTLHFASSEFGYAPWRPRLEIDFTPIPEPASALLLAAGAAALVILRRKR